MLNMPGRRHALAGGRIEINRKETKSMDSVDSTPYKMKQSLEKGRALLRLSEIERLMKAKRIIVPPLARRTLTQMCEEGAFETAGNKPTSLGWLVYEDSFWKWVRELDGT